MNRKYEILVNRIKNQFNALSIKDVNVDDEIKNIFFNNLLTSFEEVNNLHTKLEQNSYMLNYILNTKCNDGRRFSSVSDENVSELDLALKSVKDIEKNIKDVHENNKEYLDILKNKTNITNYEIVYRRYFDFNAREEVKEELYTYSGLYLIERYLHSLINIDIEN